MNAFAWKAGILLGAAVLVPGIGGCQDKTKSPGVGRPDPLPADEYPQIVATGTLDKFLGFGEPVVRGGRVREGGPLSITVPMRLLSKGGIYVQYRFEFFDRDNRPLAPQMQWRRLALMARVEHFLEGSSIDDTAVDWRLVVRPAR